MSLHQVTEQQFYGVIMNHRENIVSSVEGPYPYTSIFTVARTRAEVGRKVDVIPEGHALPVSHYYLRRAPS